MQQLFQDLRDGSLLLQDVPCPAPAPGRLVIQGVCSLISAGTERMLLDFGRGSWLQKIRTQPDKVRQVRQKIGNDGLVATLQAVRRKLAAPIPMGYSHVGRVLATGPDTPGFAPGDLVLSNGNHAEIVSVPRNLCTKVPLGLEPEEAAFGIVGAIALQGIRLAAPTLGERVAVIGLGLIGQLAVQLLLAQGCHVLAIDLDPAKVALAEDWGATGCVARSEEDPITAARTFTRGLGIDAVILAAATTRNTPLVQAAEMSRVRGRIVLVGVVAIQAPRDLFYKKELTFQVSCSYGPGRYDGTYEERGLDYPFGHVRWTEQRNIEAVLEQMAARRLRCEGLLSRRVPFREASSAYATLLEDRRTLGVLLTYPTAPSTERIVAIAPAVVPMRPAGKHRPGIVLVGAGQYTLSTLLPALEHAPDHRRVAIVSRHGASAALAARQHGFGLAATDLPAVLRDSAVDAVVITTRHDTHADLVVQALEAGKHVFVEKPLAINRKGLAQVERAMASRPDLSVTVGFNRPWAPMARRLKEALASRSGPLHLLCEINAGALPVDHWTRGDEGGGRLVGEGCHFIDLMRHWVDRPIAGQDTRWIRSGGVRGDAFTLTLQFEDGSLGTLLYSTDGNRSYPKETYTAHWDGKAARLENFRRLEGWGVRLSARTWGQDKGHAALLAAWLAAIGRERIQDPASLLEVSRVALLADEQP